VNPMERDYRALRRWRNGFELAGNEAIEAASQGRINDKSAPS
jgi:hypothetical protein